MIKLQGVVAEEGVEDIPKHSGHVEVSHLHSWRWVRSASIVNGKTNSGCLSARLGKTGIWCFPNLEGGEMGKSNLLFSSYKPLLKTAGLPSIRFHDLRHTAATLLFVQGIHPKVVSEMLRHASVSITLDLYSHVLPNMQRETVGRMDELLNDSGEAAPDDAPPDI